MTPKALQGMGLKLYFNLPLQTDSTSSLLGMTFSRSYVQAHLIFMAVL